jgi:hypothetical protein
VLLSYHGGLRLASYRHVTAAACTCFVLHIDITVVHAVWKLFSRHNHVLCLFKTRLRAYAANLLSVHPVLLLIRRYF